jgi:hypothetical protein
VKFHATTQSHGNPGQFWGSIQALQTDEIKFPVSASAFYLTAKQNKQEISENF